MQHKQRPHATEDSSEFAEQQSCERYAVDLREGGGPSVALKHAIFAKTDKITVLELLSELTVSFGWIYKCNPHESLFTTEY